MTHDHPTFIKTLDYIDTDGIKLALHGYVPKIVRAVVFYIHGIQSHADWLSDVGPELARDLIAVFILDRRGSGMSEGLRGDIPTRDGLLKDHWLALKKVRESYPDVPLTLLGHSMGGSILSGLIAWSKMDVPYEAVVFCASALGKYHHKFSDERREEISNYKSMEYQKIELDLNDFTSVPKYFEFMSNDKLACLEITKRTHASLLAVENLYWKMQGIVTKPSVYVFSSTDPFVYTTTALKVFDELTGGKGLKLELPTNKHYFWFTEQRQSLLKWLSHYVLTAGYTK
jgi:pimeloyl-ACP methyl ester carboxylesterase